MITDWGLRFALCAALLLAPLAALTAQQPSVGAPSGLAATAGNRSIALTWDDPSDASITGYEFRVHADREQDWREWKPIAGSTHETTAHTLPALTNGVRYRVQVRARNAAGAGAPSETSAEPQVPAARRFAPGAPNRLTATPDDGTISLARDDPNDDGFFFTLSYGASFPADREFIRPDNATLGAKSNVGWLGGRFSLGYAVFGFRPEVSVGYRTASVASATFEVAGSDRADALSEVEGTVGSLDLAAGVYYGLDTGLGITPYLGGGAGMSLVTLTVHGHGAADVDTDDSAWAFSFQGAAGIGVAVTERMSVTLGYRLTGTLEAKTREQSTLALALIHSAELGFAVRLR